MTSAHPVSSSELDSVRSALADEYDVIRELGRGGMAAVYEARERQLGRSVAVKVLPITTATDGAFIERFEREVRTAARLEHPNIVPIHRVGRRSNLLFFAMKLIRGPSLGDLLLADGPLGAPRVRQVLLESCAALGYAHRHGVVHRDVKPDNIMLDDGRCVLTDFGIARSGDEVKLTATGTALGTPLYMSPEQGRGALVDGRSDIYSLGVVAFECLTGAPPFSGDTAVAVMMHHLQTPLPMPRLANAEEQVLFAVVARMLAKSPQDRYRSMDEVVAALTGQQLLTATRDAFGASVTTTVPSAPPMPDGTRGVLARLRERWDAGAAVSARIGARLARISRRQWIAAAVTIFGAFAAYRVGRYIMLSRSRCPVPAPAAPNATSAANGYTIMLDGIGSISRGSDLEAYYDVCGLDRGTLVTTQLSVTKNESGLRRLFSGVSPVSVSFDETASGPRARHHHTLVLEQMPAGSYTLTLTVTDSGGRRRERAVDFQILGS